MYALYRPTEKVCEKCGTSIIANGHECVQPKCALCGDAHLTGRCTCKNRYQVPYVVRRRRRKRRKGGHKAKNATSNAGDREIAAPTKTPAAAAPRNAATERSRSSWGGFNSQPTWADKVAGTGKVAEHVILKRATKFAEERNLFPYNLIGFRPSVSTQDVMLLLKHKIIGRVSRDTRAVLELDLEKAFGKDNPGCSNLVSAASQKLVGVDIRRCIDTQYGGNTGHSYGMKNARPFERHNVKSDMASFQQETFLDTNMSRSRTSKFSENVTKVAQP
ncbi:hypothetical protein HPB51_017737 [Rhipicephalus microplus]|uniref:Uncharacterized protein n=1 Tax=Rhipicephalus microplus TaxID=6941 RepID=A0A9J6ENR0_RHIMP|nr:hypothetical protein HPB51_017737 [Rhipicephalus microplus]